jgi:hypothetical protein
VPGAVAQEPPEEPRKKAHARHARHLRLREGHEKLAEVLGRLTEDDSPEARRAARKAMQGD